MKKMDGWMDESLALLVATKGQGIGDLQLQEQRKGGRELPTASSNCSRGGRKGGRKLFTYCESRPPKVFFFFSVFCRTRLHETSKSARTLKITT
jgi:hypothetical protein